jgi:hypothetical protein
MKTINLLLFLILSAFLLCCKSDTTGPSTNDTFSVNVTVKNAAGNPVPGLRISWWNKFPDNIASHTAKKANAIEKTLSATAVGFAAPAAGRVTITVFDWNNSPVETLMTDQTIAAGRYIITWNIHLAAPTRVFTYRLVARDTAAGAIIFRDSLIAVLLQPDAAVSVGGWTSATGTFRTNDSLLFPNVLALPPLAYTSAEGPDVLGTFSFGDTLFFGLSDTVTNSYAIYKHLIKRGLANDIPLTWNPTITKQALPARSGVHLPAATMDIVPGTLPTQWRLYQNYPNPFN